MQNTIPLRKETTVVIELMADDLVHQTQKILAIKEKAMKEGVHYGTIPGTNKPSLWKPGAEKLCKAFRLKPEFETTSRDDPNRSISWKKWDYDKRKEMEGTTRGYVEYDSRCTLIHIPTEEVWAKNVSASCNNFETRYRSLSPYNIKNTLEKMSEKRSLVAAVLIGTAASDIFTQDIEDIPQLINGEDDEPAEDDKPSTGGKAPSKAERSATERQINFIKSQLRKKRITHKTFFEEWEDYFESWDFIPFNTVNDILEWIAEQ